MPNGRTHRIASLSLAAALIVVDPLMSVGAAVSVAINPDLDLTNSDPSTNFGFIWRAYWWGYGKIFSHRGTSHIPILGTITRLLWISPTVYLLWKLGVPPDWLGRIAIGIAVSDTLHWLMDITSTGLRRRF